MEKLQLDRALRSLQQGWKHIFILMFVTLFLTLGIHSLAQSTIVRPHPKVILISLDGATRDFVNQYLASGVLSPKQGIGLLKSRGVYAEQNTTCRASLTAACHIAIATGSTAAKNDINSNTFHLVASPLTSGISGFGAPIGGYSLTGNSPTAQPLWVNLLAHGKKVVTATFPGADGVDVKLPGLTDSPIIQPSSLRTVNYTVPFGALASPTSKGFHLTAANFSPAPSTTISQLHTAGKVSYSPIQQASLNDNFTTGGVTYDIQVAALDTTNDHQTNYDTLVFFDATIGIHPGPFNLPSTGPAYVVAQKSSPFYLEGSSNRAGTAFYVSYLAPDLNTVRIARYTTYTIPTHTTVQGTVNDILTNVGFWVSPPDFRITEKLSSGLNGFPDTEIEAIYEDQVRNFVDYQTRIALRAIKQNPSADLVMVYIEQPDGSEHQFLLTDPRQPSDFSNPNSIGAGQDQAKVARYHSYIQTAYRTANDAVQRIINAVGINSQGVPNSNIIVVSDHGFSTFHTSVNLTNYLTSQGFSTAQVRAYTSGPVANIYINLKGRESEGSIDQTTYTTLQRQIVSALSSLTDTNPIYAPGGQAVFDKIYTRPLPTGTGTSTFIGRDTGDIFAIMRDGYNFDGLQHPAVTRSGETNNNIFSVPNFYGAHGYDPNLPKLSAIFYAAGPNITRHGSVGKIRNIDIAPTINSLLGVPSAPTVEGKAIRLQ